nr:hypothetical protein [uncultured Faecalimonas sp.]
MEIKKILQNQEPQAAMKQLMSDEIMDLIHENMKPRDTIMAYYRCAIMEVETKFKVLNEQAEELLYCANQSAALDMKMQKIRNKI